MVPRFRSSAVFVTIALFFAMSAHAQNSSKLAETYFKKAIRITNRAKNGVTGESWCWHASYYMGRFTTGYRAFDDTTWLDRGVQYYDAMVDLMKTGPDGYKGWIGPYIYDKSVWCDAHIGDAILFNHMLDFAVLVHDNPELHADYSDKAQGYVRLARKHLLEKWDSRGTWYEDGPFGGYVSWDHYGDPGDYKNWTKRPDVRKSTLSLPFNKQNSMAVAALRIWRVTGEKAMREKARSIFSFMRSRFQLLDDHYVWCYWEPLGPHDIKKEADDTRHWMAVHPYRNYQAGEIGEIVEAYHSGIVFKKTDIQRIINTNLEVMFNGSMDNPKFRNSNAALPGYKAPKRAGKRAGTLWTALNDFSETVRKLQKARLPNGGGARDAITRAFFKNVVLQDPVSFERDVVDDPPQSDLPQFPTHESQAMTVRCVLPSVIDRDGEAFVLCKTVTDGEVVIDVVDASGKTKIAHLSRARSNGGMDGHAGIHILRWNGTSAEGDPIPPGNYRVRWTFGDQYREFPVTLK